MTDIIPERQDDIGLIAALVQTERQSVDAAVFFFLFHRLLEIAQEEEEEEDSIPLLLVWRPENVGNVATRRISVFLFYPMANWRFLMERPPFLRLIKWWIGLSRVTYDTRLLSLSGALYGKCYSYF